jgi:heat shock protein HtpX
MVERLAMTAQMSVPKVGISQLDVPNAFAFGRSKRDGRVCVTLGLLKILSDDELEAVIGHELSHLRHRDMVVLTMLSVIPLICYFVFWSFLWQRRRNDAALIAFAAFGLYIVTNLIVLYVNRIREYYADVGSGELTHRPASLASALYRITVSTTRIPKAKIKQAEGMKAFFATDPSKARSDTISLQQADLNMDGHLDQYEIQQFAAQVRTSYADRMLEFFSSHPNVIERIKRLADMS